MNPWQSCYFILTSAWFPLFYALQRPVDAAFDRFYKFPHYIETTTFGISCDAYTNLKETLTRHKPMVAEYLDKNYDRVRRCPLLQ